MAKNEQKAVTKTEPTSLQTVPTQGEQEIISSDIIIPRLLLMQGLSEAVTARKAQLGDMVRSTTLEKLGDPDHGFDFIPLKYTSDWIDQELVGQKYKYRGMIPRNTANDDMPWDYEKNGGKWRRAKAINVFALLLSDIGAFQKEMKDLKDGDMPDLSKSLLPISIRFQVTGMPAGKAVATYFAQVRDMLRYSPNVKSYNYSLHLGCYSETNDKGTFYVFQVDGKPKKIPAEYMEEAQRWFNTLSRMSAIRVDESDLDEESGEKGATARF